MRPVIVVLALLTAASTAGAFEADLLRPRDGLPPLGDFGTQKGPVERSCHQTYEQLNLQLTSVKVDGVEAPPLVDVGGGDGVSARTVLEARISNDVVDPSVVDLRFDLAPDAGVGTPFQESFYAR